MHRASKAVIALNALLRAPRRLASVPSRPPHAHLPHAHLQPPLRERLSRSVSTMPPPLAGQAASSPGASPASSTHAILKTISRMSREKAPWRLVAQETGLSAEECQRLYYTRLDWRVPHYWSIDGGSGGSRPDKAQIARFLRLVEQQGYSFDEIADRRLLSKRIDSKRYIRYYHPLVLEEKYAQIVRLRKRQGRKLEQRIMELASRQASPLERRFRYWLYRSVELFGQDWERVAEQTNTEMASAYNDKRARLVVRLEAARKADNTSDKAPQKARVEQLEAMLDKFDKDAATQVHTSLTAEAAQALFRDMQLQDQDWAADDDGVLVFMVLQTMRQNCWSTPTQVPTSRQYKDADDYWVRVANAVGNHSPQQCLQRWRAMTTLDDESKQTPLAQWHRFEEAQFWMAWEFFASQPQILQKIQENFNVMINSTKPSILEASATALSKAKSRLQVRLPEEDVDRIPEGDPSASGVQPRVSEHKLLIKEFARIFSLSDLVANFQRYRGTDQCQKHFERAMEKLLSPSFMETNKGKRPLPNRRITFYKAIQEGNVEPIVHFIRTTVAGPLLARTLQHVADPAKDFATTEDDLSMLPTVPWKQRLRSLWNPARRKQLQWLVIGAKEGVKVADENVDWDRIARQLMQQAQEQVQQPRPPNITSQQCLSTWRFILAEQDLLEAEKSEAQGDCQEPGVLPQKQPRTEQPLDGSVQQQRQWLEHELVSLELGVRRFGTSWADIRAQYLPSRQVSEIHQKWFEHSSDASVKQEVLRRAQEEDYQALMHALKVSSRPTDPVSEPHCSAPPSTSD